MPQVLRTRQDSPYDVEIANVGRLAGNARGGITVERAARTLPELQDAQGEPLTGSKLTSAAKQFADARGLQVDNVRGDVDEEALRVEAGAFPAGPSIEELSARASQADQAAMPAAETAFDAEPDEPEVEAPPPLDQSNEPGKEG